MDGQRHAPAALSPGKTQSPYEWVGTSAGLHGCGKSRPPTRFDRRTVQLVASPYIGCYIPAHLKVTYLAIINSVQATKTYKVGEICLRGTPPCASVNYAIRAVHTEYTDTRAAVGSATHYVTHSRNRYRERTKRTIGLQNKHPLSIQSQKAFPAKCEL